MNNKIVTIKKECALKTTDEVKGDKDPGLPSIIRDLINKKREMKLDSNRSCMHRVLGVIQINKEEDWGTCQSQKHGPDQQNNAAKSKLEK